MNDPTSKKEKDQASVEYGQVANVPKGGKGGTLDGVKMDSATVERLQKIVGKLDESLKDVIQLKQTLLAELKGTLKQGDEPAKPSEVRKNVR